MPVRRVPASLLDSMWSTLEYRKGQHRGPKRQQKHEDHEDPTNHGF